MFQKCFRLPLWKGTYGLFMGLLVALLSGFVSTTTYAASHYTQLPAQAATTTISTVYVGCDPGRLCAVEALTGAMRWSTALPGFDVRDTTPSSIVNGIIYYNNEDNLFAVNARTGAVVWSVNQNAPYIFTSPRVAANGLLYIGGPAEAAFNASTGALVWKAQTEGQVETATTLANNIAYFGTDQDFVYAVNASTGTILWKFQAQNVVQSTPAFAQGVIYVGSTDGFLYALNADTGALIWKFFVGGARSLFLSSPRVPGDGHVYIGGPAGVIRALDASTGRVVWTHTTNGPIVAEPQVVGSAVYVGSEDGSVYALNTTDGSLLWSFQTNGAVYQGVAAANGLLYATSGDGFLYALHPDTGHISWHSMINPVEGYLIPPVATV